MWFRGIILGSLPIALLACGGDDDPTPPGGGGSSATAGTGGVAGGTAGSPGSGGTSGSGGTAGKGGAGAAGAPPQPDGTVLSCSGEACPHGECSDLGVSAETPCSTAYPGPVNASSTFCDTAMSGGHCLRVGPINCGQNWAVNCDGGTPTFELCAGENDRCTTSASFPARCQ